MGRWLVEQSFQGSLKFRRQQMNYLIAFCFCSLFRLGRVGAETMQVEGALGSNVLLESGNSADLHGREVVWEFTSNNGTEFTILDVGPNHPEVKPNKYFEDRLNFNLSTGDLLLSNLKTSDQGNYTISIDGQEPRKRELRIFEMKQVEGALGSNVSLESGNSANLHGHEVVWKFTSNNETEFTILDVGPNHPEVKPNKYFKDRLNFNLSTGDLLLSNLKTSDQGNYTISVNSRKLRKIDLRIFDPSADDIPMIVLSISALVFSSVYLIAVFLLNIWKCKSNRELPKYEQWKHVLYICNILQLLFILAAFSRSVHFKDSCLLNVATACIAVLLLFTLTVPFIIQVPKCRRICRFSTSIVISVIQLALHVIVVGTSIAFFIKDIHQEKQGSTFHTWNVLIASVAECTVSFIMALIFSSCRNKSNTNEKGPQNVEELQSFTTFTTEDAGSVHSN
ncbi:uncharacterized protein [Mobula birostris]|uniref:uncharacterized protein isoform X2 n=1 Tax=Mobula birostris TaxID=1983395 RepID=UPI003B289817